MTEPILVSKDTEILKWIWVDKRRQKLQYFPVFKVPQEKQCTLIDSPYLSFYLSANPSIGKSVFPGIKLNTVGVKSCNLAAYEQRNKEWLSIKVE